MKKVLTLDQAKEQAIKAALIEARGQASLAAKLLGIGRASIYRYIKRYDLEMWVGQDQYETP